LSDTDRDPQTEPEAPAPVVPEYRAARRWNIVWVVPILALVIGGWLIWRSLSSQGPVAYVRFDTADGIAAGNEVRCRSVRVGVVKDVKLADDLSNVVMHLELDHDYDTLLRKGTRFWVVKVRLNGGNISGFNTLIAGNYIELDPGPPGESLDTQFIGLENPPTTNRSIPGRRLMFVAEEAGSLDAGAPIYYRGFEVGRVETRTLDIEKERVTYGAFIRQEFSGLVKENTRFWNASGVDFRAGADGVKLRTPSLQTLVFGGVSFGVPPGLEPGQVVEDGRIFNLFKSEDDATQSTFNPTMRFVLLFEQSVRGLAKGAPVEFRGIPIGRVADISFEYLQNNEDTRIPVLVEVDPSLLRREAAEKMGKSDADFLKDAIGNGLRAALKPGSLLTGALYVDVDYYKDADPAKFTTVGEFPSIPTVSSGLALLETRLTEITDMIRSLPLKDTMTKIGTAADEATTTIAEARGTLKEIQETAASARKTLDSAEFAKLPADVRTALAAVEKSVSSVGPDGAVQGDLLRTLDELRATLRSFKTLSNTIEDKPNSLLFDRESSGNAVPKAPKAPKR